MTDEHPGPVAARRVAAEAAAAAERNGQVRDAEPDDPPRPADEWTPPEPDPAPPVDGADLLEDLLAALTRYVMFPDEHAAAAVALWIAATHALRAFECAPRLVVTSPGKRCGKTRLRDIIAGTCHRPLTTASIILAAPQCFA